MVERLNYKLVGLGFVLLLGWMGLGPQTCRSAVIWADDFNDGNYDGWTIVVNPNLLDGPIGWSGSNWSAANNYLQMLPSTHDYGVISHPSNVTVGTWSFDIQLNLTDLNLYEELVLIHFMSNDVTDLNDESEINSYYVECYSAGGTNVGWSLCRAHTLLAGGLPVPGPGWHHINVSRTTAGLITVYHNGVLIIQAPDPIITTSEVIMLWFQDMQMIDNIVVRDDVIPPPPSWNLLIIGGSVAVIVVVIVVVSVFLRRRRRAQ